MARYRRASNSIEHQVDEFDARAERMSARGMMKPAEPDFSDPGLLDRAGISLLTVPRRALTAAVA